MVGCALVVLAVFLTVESATHLWSKSRPHPTAVSLAAAVASLVVLIPLGLRKRSVGARLGSAALVGDGSLSLLGAAIAALAFVGLLLDWAVGWWWADGVAALVVAAVAAGEGSRTLRGRVL